MNDSTEIAKLFVKLALDAKEYTSAMRVQVGEATRFGKDFGTNFSKAATSALKVGVVGLVGALTLIGGAAVKSGAELESQISGVQAVLSATKEDANALKDVVLDLSVDPNLKVSAQEAAAAVEMLARNGLGAGQSGEELTTTMNEAARAVTLLSNATNADFSVAADLATDVMSIWGKETGELTSIVDGLTSVVNNSKFDINDMALAMAQGGGVAGTVGVKFEDFNGAIAAMSPLFAGGADAGTSFKVMLQRLVPQTSAAADAMVGIGLAGRDTELATKLLNEELDRMRLDGNVDDAAELSEAWLETGDTLDTLKKALGLTKAQFLDYQVETGILSTAFHNLDGSMKTMPEIVEALNTSLSGLSDKQKQAALSTIFGTDAMRAAAGLGALTREEFEKLQTTMGDTSAAENAATRIDNLSGDMEVLFSILGGLKIQIGDALLPSMRDLAQAGIDLASTYGDDVVSAVQSVTEFTTTFIGSLRDGVGFVDSFQTALATIGVDQSTIDSFTNFAERVQTAFTYISDNRDAVIGAITGIAVALGGLVVVTTVASGFALLVNPMTLLIAISAALGAAWSTNFGGIQEKTAEAWAIIKPILDGFWQLVQTIASLIAPHLSAVIKVVAGVAAAFLGWSAITAVIGIITTVGTAISSFVAVIGAITSAVGGAMGILGAIVAFLGGPLTLTITAVIGTIVLLKTAWANNWGDIQGKTDQAKTFIIQAVNNIVSWFRDTFIPFIAGIPAFWSNVWNSIKSTASNTVQSIRSTIETIRTKVAEVFTWLSVQINTFIVPMLSFLAEIWKINFQIITGVVRLAWAVILAIFEAIVVWLSENLVVWLVFIKDVFVEQWTIIKNKLVDIWQFIRDDVFTPIQAWLQETITAALTVVKEFFLRVWGEIRDFLLVTWTAILETILIPLQTWLQETITSALTALKNRVILVWNSIKSVITTAWNFIRDNVFIPLKQWLESTLTSALDIVKNKFSSAWSAIQGAVEAAWRVIGDIFQRIRDFANWISSHTFNFNINLPSLPDWALPGSPIPIHTRWMEFYDFLRSNQFSPDFDLAAAEIALGFSDFENVSGMLDTLTFDLPEIEFEDIEELRIERAPTLTIETPSFPALDINQTTSDNTETQPQVNIENFNFPTTDTDIESFEEFFDLVIRTANNA